MKPNKFLLIVMSIILILPMITPIHNVAYADSDDGKPTKLKYHKNSALALNYHRVRKAGFLNNFIYFFSSSKEIKNYSVSKSQFESQIKWLKKHDAKFLTLKEFLYYKEKGKFPKRSVWINFDDMDATIYENAYPILKKYKVPATGFVITGHVGEKNFHNLNMITESQLKEMYSSGLWEFETHTNNLHSLYKNDKSKMLQTSNSKITEDLEKSTDYLTKHFHKPQKTLAYPYGLMNDDKLPALKKAGIKYGFSLEEKAVTPDTDDYFIPRILISDDAFEHLIKRWDGFHEED
ncbi:intercellular adhesin biosynthesis polysaccharide N-deacetylase [Staphylococcus simiae]|uniref:intercellular adhesin biosynthesis polysaccharide N-deacetylase n=1 Tax=Staphylococcus simiae TaxID=308354 RepID=UPI001A95976F|nr:intercellular adhesin biosynthesis polysaccharide N-deacetylase [Staphylococcus simiae]MBO1199032.1 intercellular adhesin biosynthesis polysaccharide N-deacetylase [Staphylococcus simiae]MBO1201300.1 intercellular adhesin biosynthesis polysaccharide N-deacetylase [Staphylococcus simiae]MBO1203456.1 intercellular adhesin biosynthesis polysaccharide N-deacetylase [Staphylococcus simiae]MBO1210984.1 intercellular adhesin biosynthesis polysaccharide N-deacetylase [Staphylococcus simiae]MBO12296